MKPKPQRKEKNIKVEKNKGNTTLIIAAIAALIVAGVAYAVISSDKTEKQPLDNIKFPSYAYTNPTVLEAYKYATLNPDILEQIPCYCGCGGHAGHKALRDCYIDDYGNYDEHASFCDVCIGEAIKVKNYLASGKTLKEARDLIDEEYSRKGGVGTNTPPVRDNYVSIIKPPKSDGTFTAPTKPDFSSYTLTENFDSISDGLKLTPSGVKRAYFINTKMLSGTEMESKYVGGFVEPDAFYNKKLIGMYSADFSAVSWVELHDLGYDTINDFTIKPRNEEGIKNIVTVRPLVYGHNENVDKVLQLMKNQDYIENSYNTYKPILEVVDYQNHAFSEVLTKQNKFSDFTYLGMKPVNGNIELVKAYNLTNKDAIPSTLNSYNPEIKGNVLIIKIKGDLAKVETEADKIDEIVKTI